ncbi:MAG: hypothetical protein IPK78_11045 [Rhodospirillales bacterium]|nr:hypothetical protein [Rhodospirillales bacterium]
MFEQCRVSLEQYISALRQKTMTTRADHLLQEVRARLRHLQWLHARLLQLEREMQEEGLKTLPPRQRRPEVLKQVFHEESGTKSDPRIQAQYPFQTSDELRVLLEAFYYSAHRVRDILRDHGSDLPGVTRFEARGCRDVRNHLVEHPSRDKGVLVYSTACGGPVGPQLRLLRWSLDPTGTQDQGLHHNAREFEHALEVCLSRAISAVSA